MAAPARRTSAPARPPSRAAADGGLRVAPGERRPVVRVTAATIGSAALAIVTRPAPRRSAPRKAPVRPPLRVVEPLARRRRRAGFLALVGCAATFAVMLGLTFFQAKIAAEQMRLDDLQTQIRSEQRLNSQLRLAVAELQSPRSIVAAAERDGLHPMTKVAGYVAPTAEQVAEVIASGAAGPEGDLTVNHGITSIGAGR